MTVTYVKSDVEMCLNLMVCGRTRQRACMALASPPSALLLLLSLSL